MHSYAGGVSQPELWRERSALKAPWGDDIEDEGRYAVPMVLKTLTVLEIFRTQGPRLTLGELVRASGIPKASAYRILETLCYRGYVSRTEGGSYRLKLRLLDVAEVVRARHPLRRVAMQFIDRLQSRTGETVNLAVLDGYEVVYVEVLERSESRADDAGVGSVASWHASSLGKAIAACLREDEVARILSAGHRPRMTDKTLVTDESLRAELKQIRERGFAVDDEEAAPGCVCVGTAIVDSKGTVRGAVSVSAPAQRMPPNRVKLIGKEVGETARLIAQRISLIPRASRL